jgi:mannose-1-phosphate guanylyltransferase
MNDLEQNGAGMTHMERIRVAVVMAGGSGERFWPLSRRSTPKQLLPLTESGQTLLQESVERIAGVIPPERVFIITSAQIRDAAAAACSVPDENVLAEPCKRNTAGCLAFAASHIMARFNVPADQITMSVLTADHRIGDAAAFCDCVRAALETVESQPALGVIGIAPTRPETGYGYIELPGDAAPALISPKGVGVYPVLRFHEKPDAAKAAEFVASGRYLWNSGMFFWTLSTFLAELGHASPGHAAAVESMTAALHDHDTARVDAEFTALTNISIDYALMEKARNIVMARGDFEWEDIGSWEAVGRIFPRDEEGNVVSGDAVLVDTRDSIVFKTPGAADITVATLGLDNMVVVVVGDAVLVMPRDRAQDVRGIVEEIRRKGGERL